MNIVARSSPSATRVCLACFHSTGLNAGTPLEIASTPVIAVLPEANACSATNAATPSANAEHRAAGRDRWRPASDPVAARTPPTTSSDRMHAMNTYVGAAKILPDSRTPRRLP